MRRLIPVALILALLVAGWLLSDEAAAEIEAALA